MLDDVLHRNTQAAGSVHGDQNKSGVAICGIGKTLINVSGEDGIDYAIEPQFKHKRAGGMFVGRDHRHLRENPTRAKGTEKQEGGNKFVAVEKKVALPVTKKIAHGAPPPGFFSLGLEF